MPNPKKILFFSCEPGGAEALIPVIKLIQGRAGFDVVVVGYGYALDRFRKKRVDCIEIGLPCPEDFTLFDRYAPDMLITSATSLPSVDMSEKLLWRQACLRGVPSLAFVDQWQNYAIRFSGCGPDERLAYQPDWINCLNAIGRTEMVGDGFDNAKLLEFGQPYLSSLEDDLSATDVLRVRESLRIEKGRSIALFVSEPIHEHYGLAYGYDQYSTLEFFLSSLSEAQQRPEILIKLHPKDDEARFCALAAKYRHLSPQFIKNELSPIECIAVSSFVFGMRSIMLLEAYVLGKRVASIQPGLCARDEMVLSRHRLIPAIFGTERQNLFNLDWSGRCTFDVRFKSSKFLEFVDDCLVEG